MYAISPKIKSEGNIVRVSPNDPGREYFFGYYDKSPWDSHNGGTGYYLMKDKTQKYTHIWPQLSNDGHPSYCPTDNNLVVFDIYPNRSRIQEIKLGRDDDTNGDSVKVIVRVFSPFKYDNDTRCDLHPRWSRDGKKICFDSVFEGHRGLYVVEL